MKELRHRKYGLSGKFSESLKGIIRMFYPLHQHLMVFGPAFFKNTKSELSTKRKLFRKLKKTL